MANEKYPDLTPFRNQPYADFGDPDVRRRMEAALDEVRAQLGREWGAIGSGEKLVSVDPAQPSRVVGIHPKATPEEAVKAVDAAYRYFPVWSRTPAADRVARTLRVAQILRDRRFEFNAWLAFEAGKSWPEAEAETGEAIDFCEYYAREMARLDGPLPVGQLPGERDEMRYLPLGVGVIIPPWNFALAILAGMSIAALVTGNAVIIKPSSETPTVAARFAQVLLEAGFPPESFTLLIGSGDAIGDA